MPSESSTRMISRINSIWRTNFNLGANRTAFDTTTGRSFSFRTGRGFYKEPKVLSADIKGSINEKLDIHFDLAAGMVDTVWRKFDSTSRKIGDEPRKTYGYDSTTIASTDPVVAAYLRIKSKYGIPVQTDLAYIPKGFYSPFSFAAPQDAFFPVGSNMVGAGKFITRGEGSPYAQNMAGINVSVSPNVGYGHFRVTYGQHFQPKTAQRSALLPLPPQRPGFQQRVPVLLRPVGKQSRGQLPASQIQPAPGG